MLTAASLAAALLFDSLLAIIIILSLAVIGIYAGKGPVWAVSTEWLSAGTAAAGLAQINAISNLVGFGTTYVIGFIRDVTGSFSLALVPRIVISSGVGRVSMSDNGALCQPLGAARTGRAAVW